MTADWVRDSIDRWRRLLSAAKSLAPAPLTIDQDLGFRASSHHRPRLVSCGGVQYFAKYGNDDRRAFTEHVVGTIGNSIGAPVPEVAVLAERGRLFFGSRRIIPGAKNSRRSKWGDELNRGRPLALMDVLREFVGGGILQSVSDEGRLYGIDYEDAFASDRELLPWLWDQARVRRGVDAVRNLPSEIVTEALENLTDERVASAIACPWTPQEPDNLALALHLAHHRDALLCAFRVDGEGVKEQEDMRLDMLAALRGDKRHRRRHQPFKVAAAPHATIFRIVLN